MNSEQETRMYQPERIVRNYENGRAEMRLFFHTQVEIDRVQDMTISVSFPKLSKGQWLEISALETESGTFSALTHIDGPNAENVAQVSLDSLEKIRRLIDASGNVCLRLVWNREKIILEQAVQATIGISQGQFRSFRIAQISDIHEMVGTENLKGIIRELNTRIHPAFTVITGDVTDHGTAEQYAQKSWKALEDPVYITPGNHDVRWWNADGKKVFEREIGPLYQSFDYGGVHFVLLDSTVQFELDGKFSQPQLQWLKKDLQKLPAEMPVMLFAHHPFEIFNNITGRHELIREVQDYNILAYMCGHVHCYGTTTENGIPFNHITYVKSNPRQEFVTIEFTPNYYYIRKHSAVDHSSQLWLSGKMYSREKLKFAITSAEATQEGRVEVTAKIFQTPRGIHGVQSRIDNYGPYTPMELQTDGTWKCSIDTSAYVPALAPGRHFVGVEVMDGADTKWIDYRDYETPFSTPPICWCAQTGDLLQAGATIRKGRVYQGSQDHQLYCFRATDGQILWKYQTDGRIISKPETWEKDDEDNVIFGSEDGCVYCVREQGEVWKQKLPGSVFSDPLVWQDRVFVGCGNGNIYCLNAENGAVLWQFAAEGLMRQRPVVAGNILYAFVRNRHIWYALNALNGALVWRGNADTDESLFVCGDVRPVITEGKVWCVDAQNRCPAYLSSGDGQLVWRDQEKGISSRGMDTDGQRVFYSVDRGRRILAYDAQTVQILWEKNLKYADDDMQQTQTDCGLVYADGVVYHVAERGRITALDHETGKVLWQISLSNFPEMKFWTTPEVGEGMLLCSGIDGKLYAVSLPDPAVD